MEMRRRASRSEVMVLELIREYCIARRVRDFTYRQLMRFWWRSKYKGIHWHTVERVVRDLAERGYLRRRTVKGRRGYFVVFEVTSELAWELGLEWESSPTYREPRLKG